MTPTRDLSPIADAAAYAPSVHNTQPWELRLVVDGAGGDRLEVRADRSRQLYYLDPTGRQLHVSCGAAIEFGYLAARAEGYDCGVALRPDPAEPELLGTLTVTGASPPTADERALAAAIATRYTDRGPYADRPVPPVARDGIFRAVTDRGAWVRELRAHEERQVLISVLAAAEQAEAADPDYAAELARWTNSHSDVGIPTEATQDRWPSDRVPDVPLRDFGGHDRHPAPGDRSDAGPPTIERDMLLLLGTDTDEPTAWLGAGRALAGAVLRAATLGLSAQPLGQAIDLPNGRLRLRRELGLLGHPQFVLRVGYGQDRPRTSRRPR